MYGQGSFLAQSLIHNNTHDGVIFGNPDWRQENSRWGFHANTICANGGAGLRILGNQWQVLEANIWGCLVASNQFGIIHQFGKEREFSIRFCNVTGNAISNYVRAAPGPGCISREPRLFSDFKLRRHSPCIDAGTWTGWVTDLAGQPRFLDDPATRNTGEVLSDGTVTVGDIGAFEYQPPRANRRKPPKPDPRIK